MSLLSPAVIAAIDDLELAARVVVEGVRTGANRSPFHGYGAEFQQYRPYRQGDDLKYLDWKMFARSNRLYTRQFRETTDMATMIVIDTSSSMAFPENSISKLRYSVVLAASLAYLIVEQGNGVGLLVRQRGDFTYLPPRTGRLHLRALLVALEGLKADGDWQGADTIRRASELLRRKGLVMVLSDFYDDENEVLAEMSQLAQRGHDAAMLHVLSAYERDWPLSGQLQLRDMETGEERTVSAIAAQKEYLQRLLDFEERCKLGASQNGIDYVRMDTDKDLGESLRNYLISRRA